MQTFVDWLITEMDKRGWHNSELARQARIAQASVSMVISGNRQPGVEFCLGVARAFREPPELVFRRAGLLPGIKDEEAEEILYLRLRTYMEELSPKAREEILRLVMAYHYLELGRNSEREDDATDEQDKKP